jgi:DNA-directed RNA polymerase specialized sigma24 family protein
MRVRNRFRSLALPHLAAVYQLARQLAGPDKADDLTPETFLNAWSHFDQFDPSTKQTVSRST